MSSFKKPKTSRQVFKPHIEKNSIHTNMPVSIVHILHDHLSTQLLAKTTSSSMFVLCYPCSIHYY